jgi:hypothetical protein
MQRRLYQHLNNTNQLVRKDFELITFGDFYLSTSIEKKRYKKQCKLHYQQLKFINEEKRK